MALAALQNFHYRLTGLERTRRILRAVLFGRFLFFNSAFICVKLCNLFGAASFNLIPLGLLGSFFRIRYAFSLFNHLG